MDSFKQCTTKEMSKSAIQLSNMMAVRHCSIEELFKKEDKMEIGDIVKGKYSGMECLVLEVGTLHFKGEVLHIEEKYNDKINKGDIIEDLHMDCFEVISKVKEARVVRKWEDLKGMENGFGLTIDENLDVVRKGFHGYYLRKEDLFTFEGYLESIKCMGFKFEHKPLRTEQEVLEEVEKEAKPFSKTHFCVIGLEKGKYIDIGIENDALPKRKFLTVYMAKALADELNEIIGVGK